MSQVSMLKKVLRGILIAEKRNGIPLRQLERIYRETEGRNIPLLGYPDTAALLNSLNDTIATQFHQGQWLVFPVETEQTKHVAELVRCQNSTRASSRSSQRGPSYRSTHTKSNGSSRPRHSGSNRQMIHQNGHGKYYPNDVSNAATRNGYYNQNHRLTVNNAINTSTNAYDAIPTSATHQKQSNGFSPTKQVVNNQTIDSQKIDLMSSDNEEETNKNIEKIELECPLFHLEDEYIELDDLPAANINNVFKTGYSLRLFIALVHSPYKFWFQRQEDGEMIDGLMDRLDHFYYGNESKIASTPIPADFYRIGLMCAAMYNSQWHRAKIIDTFDESIKVFYVDYGTVGEVFKKDVRFLHKNFSNRPALAFRGCLDRVRPNDGLWTFEAMDAFNVRLEQFANVPILAKITAVNAPEETMYLDLIDTSGVIDASIANWLIESNFAYTTKKLLIEFEKRHYNEVYPSFDKLENGKYPSLQQIKEMLEDNFDFLDYENSISIPEMYGYETIE